MSDLPIPETPGVGPADAPREVSSELSAEASAELEVYVDALKRCQLLMTEGRHEEALAELNRLQAPSTEAGKEVWPVVQLVKRFPRAMLYTLSDAEPEALAEWQAVRAE